MNDLQRNACCGQVLGHTRWCQGELSAALLPNEVTGGMQTFTGKWFFPMNPNPDDICIEDIAHQLAMTCRYRGATKHFYSVAQHAVYASRLYKHAERDLRIAALLHDASETYFGDFIRPLKYLPEFAVVLEADHRLQTVINVKFGLPPNAHDVVKPADDEIYAREVNSNALMAPTHPAWQVPIPKRLFSGFVPWSPETAERTFLNEFTAIYYAGEQYGTDFMQSGASAPGAA